MWFKCFPIFHVYYYLFVKTQTLAEWSHLVKRIAVCKEDRQSNHRCVLRSHPEISSFVPSNLSQSFTLNLFRVYVYGKTQSEATHWHTGATWEDKSHSASTRRTDLPTTVAQTQSQSLSGLGSGLKKGFVDGLSQNSFTKGYVSCF